jgi:hypothetical protein
VTLRPMTEEEFGRWLPSGRDAYAKEIARNGDGDEEAARRRAGEQSERSLGYEENAVLMTQAV